MSSMIGRYVFRDQWQGYRTPAGTSRCWSSDIRGRPAYALMGEPGRFLKGKLQVSCQPLSSNFMPATGRNAAGFCEYRNLLPRAVAKVLVPVRLHVRIQSVIDWELPGESLLVG